MFWKYSLFGAAPFDAEIASFDERTDIDERVTAYSSWMPPGGADQNGEGILLRIGQNGNSPNCYFNEFVVEGVPVSMTSAPSMEPTTSSPSSAAPTSSPSLPSTAAPSSSPSTAAPTAAPSTEPSNATESGVALNYFVDVYRSVGFSMANSPDPSLSGLNPSGYPYIAYPMNVCTRNGNDVHSSSGTAYTKWQCSGSGDVGFRCTAGSDATCNDNAACNANTDGRDLFDLQSNPSRSMGGGQCGGSLGAKNAGLNFVEIEYYTAFTNESRGCPGTEYDPETYGGFKRAATNKLATGICVLQDDGTFILTKCDLNGADMSRYTDSDCTLKMETIIDWKPSCSFLDNPEGTAQSQRWFHRVCFHWNWS